MVCPAVLVYCGESDLAELLAEIDQLCGGDPSGARVFYRMRPQGAIVAGGDGGGQVLDDLWIHAAVRAHGGLEEKIRQVVLGV